jgi:hypothetical protein
MSGLVDVVVVTAGDIVPTEEVTLTSLVSSEETKATVSVLETITNDSSVAIGESTIPSKLEKTVLIEEQQEQPPPQPKEELEIVQKANEDEEVIGDVVDQFDKAVTLNPQNTSSLQQIQAVPSHLSAGIHLSHISILVPF